MTATLAPSATSPTASPGGFQTKQALAYRALRERIMDGTLAPGSRLVIEDLAAELLVSAIPVREALHLLQAERLVEMRPHLGALVAPISRDAITEVFTLMEALEVAAWRLALPHASLEHIAILEAQIAAMEESGHDYARWAAGNAAFHAAICAIAEMPRVQEMTRRAFGEWERMRRWFYRDCAPPDLAHAAGEHRAMVDALRRRDGERLERLTRAHNSGALTAYLRLAAAPRR